MRTNEEIKRQVDGLEAMKRTLPAISLFGENNWEAIDAQISIIQGLTDLDNYDEDEVSEHFYSEIMSADGWLSGDINDDLFE